MSFVTVMDKATMFKTYLRQTAALIDQELQRELVFWQNDPEQKAFVKQCKGGKRIRGTLVRLGYQLAGGVDESAIMQPAVAFEIFQTAILAHDDIIDKSLVRRGKPSLYQALGGDHYGISQTICLGDLGFFLCIELLATSEFPPSVKNRAIALFAQYIEQTIQGEILDIRLPVQEIVTENDIMSLALLKTASYSLTGPLVVGATLGGANKKLIQQLKTFGDNLGIAYQIHDDILGIFADEKTLGKSTLSDIAENKATLLIWYAKQNSALPQKKILDRFYGKKNIMSEEAIVIQQIFFQSGAYAYAIKKRDEYTSAAQNVIKQLSTDNKMQSLLEDLTTGLIKRKK